MSKLGKLNTSILLDGGPRPHYGPSDSITGRLILHYNPATSLFKKDPITADLFGPIRINVVLVGQVKIKIRRDRDLPTYHGATLFAVPFHVYEGRFEAQVNRDYTFPFEVSFAEVESGGGGGLPPSFAQHFSDYPDIVDVMVVYQLGAKVEMRGIDIKISVPEGDSAPQVKYDLPRPPLSFIDDHRAVFSHRSSVQNEYLLPEAERPQGFKQKAKAVFSSSQFPIFTVDIFCTDQKHIYPGQRLNFDIRLIRNDSKTSSSVLEGGMWPSMTLEFFRAELRAFTTVDASSRIIGSNKCHDSKTVQTLTSQTRLPAEFRKEWTVNVATGPITHHVTSFEHVKVSRLYQLKVSMVLKIANKSIRVVRECPVIVVPPPVDVMGKDPVPNELPPPPIEAGPSGTRNDHENEEAPPPTYEEAGSSKLLKSG